MQSVRGRRKKERGKEGKEGREEKKGRERPTRDRTKEKGKRKQANSRCTLFLLEWNVNAV